MTDSGNYCVGRGRTRKKTNKINNHYHSYCMFWLDWFCVWSVNPTTAPKGCGSYPRWSKCSRLRSSLSFSSLMITFCFSITLLEGSSASPIYNQQNTPIITHRPAILVAFLYFMSLPRLVAYIMLGTHTILLVWLVITHVNTFHSKKYIYIYIYIYI